MLMPKEINAYRYKLTKMPQQQLNLYLKELQTYLLSQENPFAADMSEDEIVRQLGYLKGVDVLDNKEVFDNGLLLGFKGYETAINQWFPEMADVDLNTSKSVLDSIRDFRKFEDKFKRIVIENKLNVYHKKSFRERVFPKFKNSLKIASGNQAVVNIRCAVSKWIYQNTAFNHFRDSDVVLWDPSTGWAGRLAACMASVGIEHKDRYEPIGKKWVYIGTDPNSGIQDRYREIFDFWCSRIAAIQEIFQLRSNCCGSEVFHETADFKEFEGQGSIVYTSPPYFDKEHYSEDEGQAFKKFPKYRGWRDGFLKPTIENAYKFLKPGGFFFWNIADIKSDGKLLPLEPDSLKFAGQVGFKHVETLKQLMGAKLLPGVSGGNHVVEYGGGKRKFEPVFVFQKVASSKKPRTAPKFIQDTPVEEYQGYYVKREDLTCLPPGPPFAKVRGLYSHLQTLKDRGVKVVGYYDTSISMATYGICYFSQIIGLKPVVYHYRYADGLKHNQELQLKVWEKYGAEVHVIEGANMLKIQTSKARKLFNEMYPDGVFLEPGLKFDETLDEVEKQVLSLPDHVLGGTIVICTGSGTMCAGVLRGLQKRGVSQKVIGVLVHGKSKENMNKSIIDRSGGWTGDLEIIDYAYEYTQAETHEAPFPCCPYYDRKAYKFMVDNLDKLKKPVLFWNIGGEYRMRD